MDRCRYCEELNCENCPLFDMKWGDEDIGSPDECREAMEFWKENKYGKVLKD